MDRREGWNNLSNPTRLPSPLRAFEFAWALGNFALPRCLMRAPSIRIPIPKIVLPHLTVNLALAARQAKPRHSGCDFAYFTRRATLEFETATAAATAVTSAAPPTFHWLHVKNKHPHQHHHESPHHLDATRKH